MNEQKLFTIYGARLSKDKKRANITIVNGEGDAKEYATISIKLNSKTGKTKATFKEEYVYLKVPMLTDKKEEVIETPF